jgi:EpsI family protein
MIRREASGESLLKVNKLFNIIEGNMRKYLVIIILTTLTSIFIYLIQNTASIQNEKLFDFPFSIGEWSGRDIPMEAWVYEALGTPFAILRDYNSPGGETINLAIVWYDDKEIAFHAPEACLGGVGNKVMEKSHYSIKLHARQDIQIGRLLVNRGHHKFLVLYYFVNDGFETPSQIRLRAEIISKKLRLKRTSAAFVRIMKPVNESIKESEMKLEEFLKITLPKIKKYTDTQQLL